MIGCAARGNQRCPASWQNCSALATHLQPPELCRFFLHSNGLILKWLVFCFWFWQLFIQDAIEKKENKNSSNFYFHWKVLFFFRCEIFFSIFWDGFMCVCNVRIVRNEMVFFFPLFCACTLIGILSRNRRVWTHQIFEDLERETNFSIEFSVSFSTSN